MRPSPRPRRLPASLGRHPELPWSAAVLAAVLLVQLLAHEAPGFPFGSDWGQYLQGADALWRAEGGAPYPSWRGPLYMALLGGPGQVLGYVAAGRLVSRVAAGLCVLSAGLCGRALAGRAAGAAAALLLALFPPVQQAAVQVGPYAAIGATWGLCLAAGLCAARWGGRWTAGSCGLLAGAAVATDPRGWFLVPLALGFGALAARSTPAQRWRAPAWLLAGLLLALAPTLLWLRGLPQTPLPQALREQHVLSAEMVGLKTGPDHPLAACLVEDGTAGRLATTWPCARQLAAWNLGRMVPRGWLPPAWALLALPFALLPARWGRRSVPAAGLALAAPLLALAAGLGWVEWAARYTVAFAAPLALLGPAAAAPLLRRGRAGAVAFAALLLAWAWLVLPSRAGLADRDPSLPGEADLIAFSRWLDAEAGEGATVLNCSQQQVELLLLPRPTRARYQSAGRAEQCHAWARDEDPHALFLTVHDPATGACSGECAGIEPAALGWRELPVPASAPPGVRAWRR